MKYRSGEILEDLLFTENRALYKSMGCSDRDLEGPIVGIANAWSELVAGHYNLRSVADFVRKGIHRAGGTAVEFGIPGACDQLANGHDGMKYILPSRDLVAWSVETMASAHRLDGLVLLGSCDKIVPGLLMAALRLDIPSVVAVGGPMTGGADFDGRVSDATSVSEAVGMFQAGTVGMDTVRRLEETAAPACGSCSFYGTANSMCCVAEALGMSVTGSALIPAHFAARMRASEQAGIAVVEMVKNGLSPRRIVTKNALGNAARYAMATGASTNCLLHLSAIANEIGVPATEMTEVYTDAWRDTPTIVSVNPASAFNTDDFYRSGGVPQVLCELGGKIDGTCFTVSGRTVSEEIAAWRNLYEVDRRVIRSLDDPFSPSGGVAILRGNLAPDSAATKPSAMDPAMYRFTGPARVFDREEDANEAIMAGRIREGDVVVIRYEGPKGGPGMREMYYAMKLLYGLGFAKKVALITDGRFSGTNNGCFVGHISPEAAEGGPIAIVEDGDLIEIDVTAGTLRLDLEDEEIERRLRAWKKPEAKKEELSPFLRLYARLAASAADGGMIRV